MRRPSGRPSRRIAILALVASGFALGTAQSQPNDYPDKPIRLLLPYGAGGIGDATARVVAQKMGESLGQPLVIENRASAGGVQAFLGGLQAPADGYTLVMGGNGTAISQSLFKSLPYDVLKDFTQVAAMSKFSLLLLTGPNSKFASVADLVTYAKANPGKLSFGTSSIGSTQHLAAELFKSVAGIQAEIVPFKIAGALYTSLHAGDIDLAFEFVPPVLTQIKAGKVRALAIAADRRNTSLPDVPTTTEGGLSGYEVTSFNAVSVKAGTPKAIVERLNKAFVAAIASPEVTQKLREMNSEPYALTPEQTRALMVAEIARWKSVIERANIPRN